MGRPKGLYRTLDEAIREYERHHGCVVDAVAIAPGTVHRVARSRLPRLRYLTRRAIGRDYLPALGGRGLYVADESENRWLRCVLFVRGETGPDPARAAWLAGHDPNGGHYEPVPPKKEEAVARFMNW